MPGTPRIEAGTQRDGVEGRSDEERSEMRKRKPRVIGNRKEQGAGHSRQCREKGTAGSARNAGKAGKGKGNDTQQVTSNYS